MVRYGELPETTQTTKDISAYLINYLDNNRLTAQDVANLLDRSQSYAYLRVHGKKSFTIDDIQIIANWLGFLSVRDFINAVTAS